MSTRRVEEGFQKIDTSSRLVRMSKAHAPEDAADQLLISKGCSGSRSKIELCSICYPAVKAWQISGKGLLVCSRHCTALDLQKYYVKQAICLQCHLAS